MNFRSKLFTLLGLLMTLFVAGCGGSGGSGETPPPVTVVPSSPAVSKAFYGPITGFGSVIVAGVRFDTSSANVMVDELPASEGQLQAGQIVTVHGSVNADGVTGKAVKIEYDTQLFGVIESVDLSNELVVAVGQVVLITDTTSFDDDIEPASVVGLAAGDVISVSGFVDANGNIVATHIDRKNDADRFKIKGVVSNLDATASRFNIEALTVDYSAAMLDGFAGSLIENGDSVKVKCDGMAAQCFDANGVLLAMRVKLDDSNFDDDTDEVEIEGLITRFESELDFDVAGHPVTTNAATQFRNGSAADLGPNVRVEVEGSEDANGVLLAEKIKIKRKERIRMSATVDAVDSDNGNLTMLGMVFQISDDTRFKDKSSQRLRMFGLADIAIGDSLEVRAYQNAPGVEPTIATRVERQKHDLGTEVEIQAYVNTYDADLGTIEINGITVDSDAQTDFSDDFFNQVMMGSLVRVRGNRTGDLSILADKIKLKGEDRDSENEIELEGFVTRFEAVDDFDVAGHPVTTNEFTEYKNGTADALALDVPVEVKGELNADGVIVARRIKFEELDDDHNDEVEIEGMISDFVSVEDFKVAGHFVTTTAETEYEDGSATDLADDVQVEVEGIINGDGVLDASEVEFKDVDNIRINGVIEEIAPDLSSLVVMGISIAISEDTDIDGSDALMAGQFVQVRATQRPPGSGAIVASSVRATTTDVMGITSLRGYVDSGSSETQTIMVLGIVVTLTDDTVYEANHHMILSAEQFFAAVEHGSLIKVSGEYDATLGLTAFSVTLKRR